MSPLPIVILPPRSPQAAAERQREAAERQQAAADRCGDLEWRAGSDGGNAPCPSRLAEAADRLQDAAERAARVRQERLREAGAAAGQRMDQVCFDLHTFSLHPTAVLKRYSVGVSGHCIPPHPDAQEVLDAARADVAEARADVAEARAAAAEARAQARGVRAAADAVAAAAEQQQGRMPRAVVPVAPVLGAAAAALPLEDVDEEIAGMPELIDDGRRNNLDYLDPNILRAAGDGPDDDDDLDHDVLPLPLPWQRGEERRGGPMQQQEAIRPIGDLMADLLQQQQQQQQQQQPNRGGGVWLLGAGEQEGGADDGVREFFMRMLQVRGGEGVVSWRVSEASRLVDNR